LEGCFQKQKTNKETPLLQCQRRKSDESIDTFYVSSYKPIDNLTIGQKINASLAINVFNDEMYLSLMDFEVVGGSAVAAKKDIRV
jgi:hypothetical protein